MTSEEAIKNIKEHCYFANLIPQAKEALDLAIEALEEPKAENKKRLTNAEWKDFLSEQFGISRTSAAEMLHGMMRWKGEDNFKKQFSGGKK